MKKTEELTGHEKRRIVMEFLKKYDLHPVNIAEAISDGYFEKSYKLITKHPDITKDKFLKKMHIEEFEVYDIEETKRRLATAKNVYHFKPDEE